VKAMENTAWSSPSSSPTPFPRRDGAGLLLCHPVEESRARKGRGHPARSDRHRRLRIVSLDPDPSRESCCGRTRTTSSGAPATKNLHVMYILDTTARTLALLSGNVHMIEGVRAPGWTNSIQQKNPNLLFDVAAPGSCSPCTSTCRASRSTT
jgi:hypothetical protein